MVIDTDAASEVDDQFALAYALLPGRPWDIEAVYAAPFFNQQCPDPAEGMRYSLAEIRRVFEAARVPDIPSFEGIPGYLEVGGGGVPAPAVDDLIRRGMNASETDPLYVVAIGCPANIASALLLQPRLANRIVVLWLGGHGLQWPSAEEFNLSQDLIAVRVLFGSGVALIWVPCMPVASHLLVTVPEAEAFLEGAGDLGQHLLARLRERVAVHGLIAKELWDIAPFAWLADPGCAPSRIVPSPVLGDDLRWYGSLTQRSIPADADGPSGRRHMVRELVGMYRNAVLPPFFRALRAYTGRG